MTSSMARPPLVTSISLPVQQLVSPITLNNSPGGIGSPTPTPGTETRYNFWDSTNAATNHLSHMRATPRGTPVVSPADTPGEGKKVIFWDPASKDNNSSNSGAMNASNTGLGSRVASPARSPGDRSGIWEAPQWNSFRNGRSSSSSQVPGTRRPSTSQGGEKKNVWDVRPRIKTSVSRLCGTGHRVTFSDGSTGSEDSGSKGASSVEHESSQSDSSRPGSPHAPQRSAMKKPVAINRTPSEEEQVLFQARARIIQLVDKRAAAIALEAPTPQGPRKPPFVAYTDAFLQILGSKPVLEQVMYDGRAPFFGGSGVFHRPTSTLFLTSSLLKDSSPSAAPSRNYGVTTTSLTFYADDEITRDKVRFAQNYMPGGLCVWHPPTAPALPSSRTFPPNATGKAHTTYDADTYKSPATSPAQTSSLVVCAAGTLNNPGGLLLVAARRPHTTTPLLTTYSGGRPFNSPHSCVALSDGSILFTDPPTGYEVGFRSRPQLPPLIYRFDPANGDVRAIADGLTRPTALAVSADERTLFVVDSPREIRPPGRGTHVDEVLKACTSPLPTVQAYSILGLGQGASNAGSGAGVWLTNKRLFALPDRAPTGISVGAKGDVFLACGNAGVMVYGRDGNLVGRIRVGEGESVAGVCTGRKGELFAWGGTQVWKIGLEASRLA